MPKRENKTDLTKWFGSLTGQIVDDFRLEAPLGHGKIGYVYRASSQSVEGRKVALKLTPSAKVSDQWRNEIQKVSLLSTIPGVVHFHDLGTAHITSAGHMEIVLYTVWDYIEPGRNLKQYLRDGNNRIHGSFLVAVVERILKTLHACQKKGIARHGDLHPGNILIGDQDEGDLDAALQPREQIYVSDFGYGATGGTKRLKDDYEGLARIANAVIERINWETTTPSDRHFIRGLQQLLSKVLGEASETDKSSPLDILQGLQGLKATVKPIGAQLASAGESRSGGALAQTALHNVGQFQISEMLGDRWEWWKKLFVATVPARSRILVPDISTVVTGPRGCGKTMLFRRLSERLIVECGPVGEQLRADLVGFYINANDIADAFPDFPHNPEPRMRDRLICYANLCILADILAVSAARQAKNGEDPAPGFMLEVKAWLIEPHMSKGLLAGESLLENLRSQLEGLKWSFPNDSREIAFPAAREFGRTAWLPKLLGRLREEAPWIGAKAIFLFVDDYSTPRVSLSLQRVLNRLLFQRSSEFVSKVATESATTFISEDSSGKMLQDGDDYQLIDMGEESLFMKEEERMEFLEEVFSRRLSMDPRVPETGRTLKGLLGKLGMSKTEFARRLRLPRADVKEDPGAVLSGGSQRRGASKPTVLYRGADVFSALWSGDTRIMIQLIQELVGEVGDSTESLPVPIHPDTQDRIFRDRGATWLEAQTRNQPTRPDIVSEQLRSLRKTEPTYQLTSGSYGIHLKAVVEAFVFAARQLLIGPTYKIENREVPRMAFRIEVVDEFRLEGLAAEVYRDLVRYGLFMRDARGKSVRGAMVPRLYLRRLLLPYCTLALSKRDSVPVTCEMLRKLLLRPDLFKSQFGPQSDEGRDADFETQMMMAFVPSKQSPDALYDDLIEDAETKLAGDE